MHNKHVFNPVNPVGKVIYADDQYVNIANVRRHFKDLGIEDKLITCSNGQEVLNYIDSYLEQDQINATVGSSINR